jgi:hypothetical protein
MLLPTAEEDSPSRRPGRFGCVHEDVQCSQAVETDCRGRRLLWPIAEVRFPIVEPRLLWLWRVRGRVGFGRRLAATQQYRRCGCGCICRDRCVRVIGHLIFSVSARLLKLARLNPALKAQLALGGAISHRPNLDRMIVLSA